MIDTIHLLIPAEELLNLDLLAELPLLFDEGTLIHNQRNNQVYIEGKIDCLTIRVYETSVKISGSLSRYYFGNNIYTLSFPEIALAFERLSKQLNIPLEIAKVQRLDIAENFTVEHPVFHYYSFLGDLSKYKRTEQSNGLYYSQTSFQICVYDKTNEKKDKRKPIPEEYRDQNMFRYEFRFFKKVGTNLSKKPVYVADLLRPEFFKEILEMYLYKFKGIYKHKEKSINPELYAKDRQEFWNHVKHSGIEALGGAVQMIETIKTARKRKLFKSGTDASRIIQDVKKIYERGPLSTKSILIEELEAKVVEKVDSYLN